MAKATGKKPQNMAKTLRKLMKYMGNHKFSLLLVGILVICSAGANLYGTYMLQPIIDEYIVPKDYDGLVSVILFMALMYGAGVCATAIYKQLMTHTAQKITQEIRRDLFKKMQKLPLRFFDSQTHGDIMSRFTNDIDTLQDALNNCFDNLIQSFTMIIGTLTAIFILNWQLSLLVMIFMIIMYFLIQFYSKRSKYYFSHQQAAMGKLNGYIEEMVEGSKVVKVFNHEDISFKEFEERNERLRIAGTKALTYSGKTIPTVVAISYINYAVVACIGGFFAIAGKIQLGALASYLVYVRQTALPINQFTQQLNFILAAMAGAERIFTMMDEKEEVDDGKVTLTSVRLMEDGSLEECKEHTGHWAWRHPHENQIELVPLQGDVRFHDVVFGYTSNVTVLKGIHVYAKPGQKIAFVGSTGAGKTTITNLINRFYDIKSGSITYDGIDVKLIQKADLRHSISVVLQDTQLFTGTIADNIRYGNLDADYGANHRGSKISKCT